MPGRIPFFSNNKTPSLIPPPVKFLKERSDLFPDLSFAFFVKPKPFFIPLLFCLCTVRE